MDNRHGLDATGLDATGLDATGLDATGPHRPRQADLYVELARIGKVVMHPKRIELLQLLCQAERSVESLARATELKLTTASAHLQVMRQARVVTSRREGARVYYRSAGNEVCRLVAALSDLAAARLAEVEQILSEAGAGLRSTERVTRSELLRRVRSGDVLVIDVRPSEEFESGHIPGAISLPLEHLELQLAELDREVEVVAYCRGPLCLLAPQAVAALRGHGFRARCLQGGMPEWRLAGLPISTGPYSEEPDAKKMVTAHKGAKVTAHKGAKGTAHKRTSVTARKTKKENPS